MYELYFSLIEKRGDKTNALIEEITALTKQYDLYEECTLENIVPSQMGVDEYKLVYKLKLPSVSTKKSGQVLNFFSHIFQKMFNKYPAFTEAEV